MNLAALFPGHDIAADIEVKGLSADSRKIKPGFVFAALEGVSADGREYIPQALENGAVAVIGKGLPQMEAAAAIEVHLDEMCDA